ncbi:Os01g0961800 [Oryza sativa Japonica Group]|uniref:Os01g0961800 protein n=1 Tax=Oryza sativa subsp. japonica TaxID=39947 RepID=C7IXH6_ORYSJ|nr:Os01g0961800 [Oryza sativa Japonica Group]|eukprot:NP_001172756.1 Os01g0961800 [Oryza sativa Japonica Group]
MVLHFHGIGVNSVYVFALDLGTFASHGIQPSLSITLAGLPSQSYATGSIGIIEKGAPASRQWRSMAVCAIF